jgi:hypothetical protein
MIFGEKPRVVDSEGDMVRIGQNVDGHLDLVKYYKETTDNGWTKERTMQLMAIIPTYIIGWMNKFHPDWLQCDQWKGSPLERWLETDDFGRACRVAENHPERGASGVIIK